MTSIFIPGSWEKQRARLSHDRMKNQILPMTSRLCQVLEGKVDSRGFVADFSTLRLAEIEETCREIEDLLMATIENASPRVFFSMPPLNQCPPSTLAWLPQAVHEKWLEERGVKARIEAAQGAIAKVRSVNSVLQGDLQKMNKESRMAARELQNALLRLAECLSDVGALIPYRF